MLIMLGMLIDLVIFHFSQIMKIPTARSPSTNSYNFAWDVRSSGAMDYGHYGSRSDYSYGIIALRTRVGTIILGMSTSLVRSITAATVVHIPTVIIYIRSPYTGWDDYAWQVDPSGDIPYGDYVDVYYSYGHLTR